jgi:GNAT superfamily N-acetyltransferase
MSTEFESLRPLSKRWAFRLYFSRLLQIAEVDGLFVKPGHWGRGIGRALMADAVAIARGEDALALEVTANLLAEKFYTKCGFIHTGHALTRFGPALRMRYVLPDSV